MYENLFACENPEEGNDFTLNINKDSLITLKNCKAEKAIESAKVGESYQFMRIGYFTPDCNNFSKENLVFNRSVSLKDSFKKK